MKTWFVSALLILTSSLSYGAGTGGWSAIAYDTTNGRYGYAAGTYNKQQAESTSISSCNSLNCKVVVTVYNGHAALAVSRTSNALYGTGYAPSKFEALYWAMYYCNQGPSSCQIIISVTAHD